MTLHQLFYSLWDEHKKSLVGFFFIALALHILPFFIFLSPHHTSFRATPSQPTVYLQSVNSASENDSLNSWIEWLSPYAIAIPESRIQALPTSSASTPFAKLWDTPPIAHSNTHPLNEQPQSLNVFEPSTKAHLPRVPLPMPLRVETPPILTGSQIILGDGLEQRALVQKSQPPLSKATIALRPSIYRIAVNQHGFVEFVFLTTSCGDSTSDAEGYDYLRKLLFTPVDTSDLSWGRVSIFWDVEFIGSALP